MPRVIVFGGTGQIGAACADAIAASGAEVVRTGRAATGGAFAYDPFDAGSAPPAGRFDGAVWAQGANRNDSVLAFDAESHLALYRANVLYVLQSLAALLAANALADGARLCIVSSIWQQAARRDKLSYMTTKAALQGLVMSAAIDLASRGMLVNAVLPGALDTPMTRANLAPEQIANIEAMTPFNRLASLADVAAAAAFLVSPANGGITSQFVTIDLGFSHARLV